MRTAVYFTRTHDPQILTVRDVMEDAVFTVSPQAKGSAIADILAEWNVGSVPVVEEDRTLVGLVSEFDLLRVMDKGKDLVNWQWRTSWRAPSVRVLKRCRSRMWSIYFRSGTCSECRS